MTIDDPGVDTPGVDILMESKIPTAAFGEDNPLSHDDYAGRQFLYPVHPNPIPEPATLSLLTIGAALLLRRRSGERRRAG